MASSMIGLGSASCDTATTPMVGPARRCSRVANVYEALATIWPSRTEPWARRLNDIRKCVSPPRWSTSLGTIRRSFAATFGTEVSKLKADAGGNLLAWGHGLLGETLLKERLLDVLQASIRPLVVGRGKMFFREDQKAN